jgi:ABC-2 type transport system ATP-binding protein
MPQGLRRVGFAGEFVGLVGSWSVREQLQSVARLAQCPAARITEVIEMCGLERVATRRIRRLSSGEWMRTSLAVALLPQPKLLVLDEVTNGLDADGIRWIRSLLRAHSDPGGSVLMTSHLLAEVEQIADELTILQRRPLYHGPLSGFMNQEKSLEDRYFELISEAHVEAMSLGGAER